MNNFRPRLQTFPVDRQHLLVDDKVKFYDNCVRPFVVQAVSENFVVMTKPYNPRRTTLYTIIDWRNGWRGPHNSWGYGAVTREDCEETISALEDGKIELSVRRNVYLDIEWVKRDGKVIEPAINDPKTVVVPLTELYDPATVVG